MDSVAAKEVLQNVRLRLEQLFPLVSEHGAHAEAILLEVCLLGHALLLNEGIDSHYRSHEWTMQHTIHSNK